MARASRALAEECARWLEGVRAAGPEAGSPGSGVAGSRVVVLAGSGNNGGDALYAAARLARQGARSTAVLTGSSAHQEALEALERVGGETLRLAEHGTEALAELAAGADLVVDGMLGTGGHGGLREAPAALVRGILERLGTDGPVVLACDVPSGMDASTGRVVEPVLPAHATVTFIGAKAGLLATPRPSLRGRIRVDGLGIAADLPEPAVLALEDADFPRIWPGPEEGDQKYSRGVLGTVVGSDEYPGAGLMCVRAAVAAGAGMVRFVGGDVLAGHLAVVVPEAVRTAGVGEHRVQAWAVGSGATGHAEQEQIRAALDSGLPVVADAAAVETVAQRAADGRRADPRILLTPHAGELARALEWVARLDPGAARRLREAAVEAGLAEQDLPETSPSRTQVEQEPLVWARAAHAVLGASVLLKGTTTVLAGPRRTYAHTGNSPWLATAGSGDTLTGILGAGTAARQAVLEAQREEAQGEGADAEGADAEWAGDPDEWVRTAAAALLVQRRISLQEPGPVPPSVAAPRIPGAIGRLLG